MCQCLALERECDSRTGVGTLVCANTLACNVQGKLELAHYNGLNGKVL